MTGSTYIIGGPGSGKSTLMAKLLAGWTAGPYTKWTSREMFGHLLTLEQLGETYTAAYLGRLRPEYPGTDALSLSVAPQALLWLESLPLLGLDHVYGEGVRLGHIGFLTALAACTDLTVVYLDVDPEEAARRRLARGGKMITDQWCKNATTRAMNCAAACRAAGIRVETR